MNPKLEIKGGVGVAVNAEEGASVHIYLKSDQPENKAEQLNYAVHRLLKTCEQSNCKTTMEKISQTLFSNKIFKNLTLEQLAQMQIIAEEFNSALQLRAQRLPTHRPSILGYAVVSMRRFLRV